MTLKEELGLKRGYVVETHEALLNVYYTASMMKKRADAFFGKFKLTDVQYNLMALLYYESPGKPGDGGLSQAKISDMMLVNRANITSLVDRMEKAGLVARTAHSNDRRFNIIKLTARGRNLFEKVEPEYMKQVNQAMNQMSRKDLQSLMQLLEKIRKSLQV